MDISKVTVRELLENKAACDAMNAIDPKILKSPMVKLVTVSYTHLDVYKRQIPRSALSFEPEIPRSLSSASILSHMPSIFPGPFL